MNKEDYNGDVNIDEETTCMEFLNINQQTNRQWGRSDTRVTPDLGIDIGLGLDRVTDCVFRMTSIEVSTFLTPRKTGRKKRVETWSDSSTHSNLFEEKKVLYSCSLI